jgi:hypothetical protein
VRCELDSYDQGWCLHARGNELLDSIIAGNVLTTSANIDLSKDDAAGISPLVCSLCLLHYRALFWGYLA